MSNEVNTEYIDVKTDQGSEFVHEDMRNRSGLSGTVIPGNTGGGVPLGTDIHNTRNMQVTFDPDYPDSVTVNLGDLADIQKGKHPSRGLTGFNGIKAAADAIKSSKGSTKMAKASNETSYQFTAVNSQNLQSPAVPAQPPQPAAHQQQPQLAPQQPQPVYTDPPAVPSNQIVATNPPPVVAAPVVESVPITVGMPGLGELSLRVTELKTAGSCLVLIYNHQDPTMSVWTPPELQGNGGLFGISPVNHDVVFCVSYEGVQFDDNGKTYQIFKLEKTDAGEESSN